MVEGDNKGPVSEMGSYKVITNKLKVMSRLYLHNHVSDSSHHLASIYRID